MCTELNARSRPATGGTEEGSGIADPVGIIGAPVGPAAGSVVRGVVGSTVGETDVPSWPPNEIGQLLQARIRARLAPKIGRALRLI
jgi:hypothetical protein